MKAVLLILGALAAGTMARLTTSCPQGAATCDAAASTSATGDHSDHAHEDSHNHETGTGTGKLGPSPTNSGVCHDMGDYWHCTGAMETGKPNVAVRAGLGMGAAAVAFGAFGM